MSVTRARCATFLVALFGLWPVPSCERLAALTGSSSRQGAAIFSGDEQIPGAFRGHHRHLSAESVRCRNCHAQGKDPAPEGAIGPRIDRALLLDPRPDRAGPRGAYYDERTLCTLLRTGVDPGHIQIGAQMPVYEISDDQCAHLWRFLAHGG